MKILILGADDVVTNLSATPFIRQLAGNDLSEIDMLISGDQQPLFITNPDIRKIHLLRSRFSNRWPGRLIYRINILKNLLTLRDRKYDCLIYLTPVSVHQRRIWKVISGVKSAEFIINSGCHISCSSGEKASQNRYPDKSNTYDASLKLYPDLQAVTVLARRYCIYLTSYNIGIIVNSASSVNRPPEEWACLIRKLAVQGRIFLIKAENKSASVSDDMALMSLVESLCSNVIVTVTVTTGTADYVAMISLCSHLISADTEAAWMGAALRVPVICPQSAAVADIPPGCRRVSSINAEEIFSALVSDTLH